MYLLAIGKGTRCECSVSRLVWSLSFLPTPLRWTVAGDARTGLGVCSLPHRQDCEKDTFSHVGKWQTTFGVRKHVLDTLTRVRRLRHPRRTRSIRGREAMDVTEKSEAKLTENMQSVVACSNSYLINGANSLRPDQLSRRRKTRHWTGSCCALSTYRIKDTETGVSGVHRPLNVRRWVEVFCSLRKALCKRLVQQPAIRIDSSYLSIHELVFGRGPL